MDRIWYQNLVKPSFTPNGGIFAPVWSVLYFLIFLSLIFFILTKSKANCQDIFSSRFKFY
ncbi:MAG: tryptophan-rich sensory protein [Candidatus Melainabacteria bacterium]|nr:MAG: tryptophan-rich sensory protein [Candidatus Melainabacteria bacterium]